MRPSTVATIRGVILAGATAGIDAVITATTAASWGELAPWQPVILGGLRVLEGLVDEWRGQGRQRPLGSGPLVPIVASAAPQNEG